ncbi:MAG TPA: Calx-beta domain-containing protein [Pyrinomonadaceae bacterium]|nr:Calx-beta domain-containing protein [Pyrinomonadaceae bacterium]
MHRPFYFQKPSLVVSAVVFVAFAVMWLSSATGEAAECLTPTFTAAPAAPVSGNPSAVAVADFNGDLKNDLAVANQTSNSVAILLGAGGGSFGAPTYVTVGSTPRAVAVGNLNADAFPDVAVTNYASNSVSVLIGTGAGTFVKGTDVRVGAGPRGVGVADFDKDGKGDLVVANQGSNSISVLKGLGTGAFNAAVNYASGTGPTAVAVADMNGDGNKDFVVTNEGFITATIFINSGTGTFPSAVYTSSLGTEPRAVAVADFDNDGWQDLAVVNRNSNQLRIQPIKPPPVPTIPFMTDNPVATTIGQNPVAVVAGDFNGDGNADVAVSYENGTKVSRLLGGGNYRFGGIADYQVGSNPLGLALGDFNGDGKPDLVTANNAANSASILLNTSCDPPPPPPPSPTPTPSPTPRPTPPPPGPDGLIAFASFVPDQQYEIFVMTSDGKYPTRLTYNSDNSTGEMPPESDFPAWSPDGSSIAFRIFSIEQNISGLYLIDADGSNQRPLTHGYAEHPTWSPDGNRIAFISQSPTTFKFDIHVVNSDGTGETNITNDAEQDNAPAWSPDGSKIAFMRVVPGGTFNIFTINPDGSGLKNLTGSTQPERFPAWSPDGSKIAFSRGNQIFVMNADGSNAGPLPTNAFGWQPTWSPDGSKIVFLVGGSDSGELYVMNADGSDQRPLTNAPAAALKEAYPSFAASALAADASKQPNWQRNPPQAVFVNDVKIREGNAGTANAVFTVKLSQANSKVVTVNYATANSTAGSTSDYAAAGGTLTFNPGVTSKTVLVKVNGDLNIEPDEKFFLNLKSPTNAAMGDAQGVGTIINDDFAGTLQFSASAYTVSEAAASSTITVTRTGGSLGAVTVAYATSNGTASATSDYASATGTLTFAPGDTAPKTFTVTIKNDLLDEANEIINLRLGSPTGGAKLGARSVAALSIVDDDTPPSITVTNASVAEPDTGVRGAVFYIRLSRASGRPVTVKYATANGTTSAAAAGTDYTAVALTTLTFTPGQTAKIINVQVKGDTVKELNETFFVNLSAATNAAIADGQGLGTIVNDD